MPRGRLLLDAASRLNFHVEHNEAYRFSVFEPSRDDELAEVELEVRLLAPQASPAVLDSAAVVAALAARYTGHVLAAGQVLVLAVGGHDLRLRVAQADVLDASAREEAVGYHSYRGVLTPATAVYLRAHAAAERADDDASRGGGVELRACPLRPPTVASANRVAVTTSDDELFVVHKSVLRPCIALTGATRSAGPQGGSEVRVDVGCLVFDRVLLHLESLARGTPPPEFAITLVEELGAAARTLGLRSLEEACAERLGAFSARLREYSFDEIKRRNAEGECLIIVDGMVLDVTRWLPEHPGGSTIIPSQARGHVCWVLAHNRLSVLLPRQALNMDCARFYELYHASRESFLYVRHFYIGEQPPCRAACVRQLTSLPRPPQARWRRRTARWCRSRSRGRARTSWSSSSCSRPFACPSRACTSVFEQPALLERFPARCTARPLLAKKRRLLLSASALPSRLEYM